MTTRTYRDITYHIVFSTKRRSPSISIKIMKQIRGAFKEKAAGLGFTIHISNGRADHVHILVSASPQWCASDIVKNLKGYSSYKISGLYWQRGFGVFTVDRVSFHRVFNYIKNQ
ncbi:MAG: IS200/IS605 family transposase [Spirochaetes bacterium]|nr:IS200/IS605 family transposase [Spirochaetota bacterium]